MSLRAGFSHSLSLTSLYELFLFETSPAGNIPTHPPASRCLRVSRIPVALLRMLFRSPPNGFTGITNSFIGSIFSRRKLPIILKSERISEMILHIRMPSIAPRGWFETMINAPVFGILARSSSKTIYFSPLSRIKASKNALPLYIFILSYKAFTLVSCVVLIKILAIGFLRIPNLVSPVAFISSWVEIRLITSSLSSVLLNYHLNRSLGNLLQKYGFIFVKLECIIGVCIPYREEGNLWDNFGFKLLAQISIKFIDVGILIFKAKCEGNGGVLHQRDFDFILCQEGEDKAEMLFGNE